MKETRLIAGAMSGTSADGVDIALARIHGHGIDMRAELLLHYHHPYPSDLKNAIHAVRREERTELRQIASIGQGVSLSYVAAVKAALRLADLKASDLTAIAAHGQTLFHDVPLTIQYFDPSLVTYETGIAVISDFRRADLAAGGQGAPLVPFADFVLFRDPAKNCVLLNLGGIANLTFLRAGGKLDEVIAFDTGPANCVSDWICRTNNASGPGYDAAGQLAQSGTPNLDTARLAAKAPYILKRPPKSTDGPAMIEIYQSAKRQTGFAGSLADDLATACLFTAYSLAAAFDLGNFCRVDELLISGGGTQNPVLMKEIGFALAGKQVRNIQPMDERWVQSKEALAFALLGAATLDGLPSNVPSVTGARRAVVLGSITPRP